jgi:hypothetical protein
VRTPRLLVMLICLVGATWLVPSTVPARGKSTASVLPFPPLKVADRDVEAGIAINFKGLEVPHTANPGTNSEIETFAEVRSVSPCRLNPHRHEEGEPFPYIMHLYICPFTVAFTERFYEYGNYIQELGNAGLGSAGPAILHPVAHVDVSKKYAHEKKEQTSFSFKGLRVQVEVPVIY